MDFWQFGIYIVILSGASSLVIMTIILLVRKMNQDKPSKARPKSKKVITEWARAPAAVSMATPSLTNTPNTTGQSAAPHEEEMQPEPNQENPSVDSTDEMSLISPLSTPGAIEPALITGASILEAPQTTDVPMAKAINATLEENNGETNGEHEVTEGDSDPLSIFQMEDAQENPISELSASLPDIDVSTLLRESKEVLRILGVEAEEY